jgi:hypothetical protein
MGLRHILYTIRRGSGEKSAKNQRRKSLQEKGAKGRRRPPPQCVIGSCLSQLQNQPDSGTNLALFHRCNRRARGAGLSFTLALAIARRDTA